MVKFKMLFALFCAVLLIGHEARAVVNKATSQIPLVKKEEEKPVKVVKADDRISNTFASPSDEYGPPLGIGFNGPAPIYGPPELVGDHGPTPVYPPPPPDVPPPPPPVFGPPAVSYGPPRSVKPQYGPPKQNFVAPLSAPFPKPGYGPPKLHYGLPLKQHYIAPVSFPPLRLPKPQYGLPLKFADTSSQQYVLPPAGQHGPPKPGHGPPIPISLETYGPPPPKLAIQFNPLPNDEYGPPPLPVSALQPQYGPPTGDLYGPPPPAPPPGVPAPPTPPDIKYDGWQPIAGLASAPNQSGQPADTYGPPESKHNYVDGASSTGSRELSHASLTVSTNPHAPSDSYGVPIHSPEAQDLKTSVHKTTSSESNGLPPPPLPQREPLHNNQGPGVVNGVSQIDSYGVPIRSSEAQDLKASLHGTTFSESNGLPPPLLPQQHELLHNNQISSLQYGAPNIEPLSIVKTVGFQLLPATGGGAPNTDLQSLSLSGGAVDLSSYSHISGGGSAASVHSGLELTAADDGGASHALALANAGADVHGLQSIGTDLPLPQPLTQHAAPSNDYGAPPLNTVAGFGQVSNGHLSGTSLLSPPPPLDSYGAPPLSSYSPNGPYPTAQGGRGVSLLGSFGTFGGSYHKQNSHHHPNHHHHHHHHRLHGAFRPPAAPLGSLIPPRVREPIKFREPIPTGLLSSINRYLPPFGKQKTHGGPASLALGQQLPNLHAPVSFRDTAGGFGGLFAGGGFAGHNLDSPIAAPHVQYGTPLSFTDFNTPAPQLTYGAPNFGPATSFVSTSVGFGGNLYSGVGNALTATYGTPMVNHHSFGGGGGGNDCNSLQPLLPASGELPLGGSLPSGGELHSAGEAHSSGEALSGEGLSLGVGLPDKLQLAFDNAGNHGAENHGPVFTGSLLSTGGHQSAVFAGDALPQAKPFDNTFLSGPSVNGLELQHAGQQQKTDLKDSYGNPIGLTYDSSNEASDSRIVHASAGADVSNELTTIAHTSSQSGDIYSAQPPVTTSFEHGNRITAEALTASLTAQGLAQGKSLGTGEVDASQFLKSSEGSEALSLAQGLTANGMDGFEIHGSKGIYTLQIQPADGGLGTENSDGSIRHDQVLSNGLLQDILAAIEQPENGVVQLQGPPEPQPLEKVLGAQAAQAITGGHFITVEDSQTLDDGPQKRSEKRAEDTDDDGTYSRHRPVALFVDTKYAEARKGIRSVPTSESSSSSVARENEQSHDNAKSS